MDTISASDPRDLHKIQNWGESIALLSVIVVIILVIIIFFIIATSSKKKKKKVCI